MCLFGIFFGPSGIPFIMENLFLCVDIGTSSLKAAAITQNGKTVHKVRKAFDQMDCTAKDFSMAGKWLECFYEAHREIADAVLKDRSNFEAICISGNGPSLVAVTENADLYRSPTLLWNQDIDEQTEAKIESAQTKLRENRLPSFSIFLPRIIAFKEIYRKDFADCTHLLSGPEFLAFALTHRAVTFLPESRWQDAYWTDRMLSCAGFEPDEIKKMPPFIESGSIIDADDYGTPVVAGLPDFAAALLGTATVLPGRVCLRSGTSQGLNLCTAKPMFSDHVRTLPSVIPCLWNAGVLFQNSTVTDQDLAQGYMHLLKTAEENHMIMEDSITICGGQATKPELIQKKQKALREANPGAIIRTNREIDSELLGDLSLCLKATGHFSTIQEASLSLEEKN